MSAYRIIIERPNTSQGVVAAIARRRGAHAFSRAFLSLGAILLTLSGVGFIGTATATTAQAANADVITDWMCSYTSDSPKSWADGKEKFGTLGGSTQSMEQALKTTKPDELLNPGSVGVIPNTNAYRMTALEKYGVASPYFESWQPAWNDSSFTFHGVGPSGALGEDAIGTGTAGVTITAADSPMITNASGKCLNPLGVIEANVANIITMPMRVLLGAAISSYDAAAGSGMTVEGSPFHGIAEKLDELVAGPGGLRDSLFIPFIIPIILIGACWIGYVGIVKRAATVALQGTVWMVAAIAAGTVFLAQPSLIAGSVDWGVQEAQSIIHDSVLTPPFASDLCKATGEDVAQRTATCIMWEKSLYEPWVEGQFGGKNNNTDPRNILSDPAYAIQLGSEKMQATSWAEFHLDRQATGLSLQVSEVAYAQLSGAGGAEVNKAWAGGKMSMVSAAIQTWLTVGVAVIVPIVFSLILIMLQLLTMVAVILSPLFFLFGIIPNWGRRVLVRYAELLVNVLLKRVVIALFLSLYFYFYAIIAAADLAMLVNTVAVAALAMGTFWARRTVGGMLDVNFGGNKSIGLPGGKLAAAGAGVVGTISGGLLAGAMTAKKVRAEGSSFEGNGAPKLEGGSSPVADVKKISKAVHTVERVVEKTPSAASNTQNDVAAPVRTESPSEGRTEAPASGSGSVVRDTPAPTPTSVPAGGPTAASTAAQPVSGTSSAAVAVAPVRGTSAREDVFSHDPAPVAPVGAATSSTPKPFPSTPAKSSLSATLSNPAIGFAMQTAADAAGDVVSGGESAREDTPRPAGRR